MLVCWWEQYHDTATSGTDYSDLRNRDNFVQCVMVNTLQYHETVDFVQDSVTEDPQLESVILERHWPRERQDET